MGSIIPLGSYYINDTEMSLHESWKAGFGVRMFITGVLSFPMAFCIYFKKKVASFVFVSMLYTLSVVANTPLKNFIQLLIWVLFFVWYFFFKNSSRKYFFVSKERGEK